MGDEARRRIEALVDPAHPARIHVLNAGGAGMSAIATLLAEMGHTVSGEDPAETPFVPALRRLGVAVATGPDGAGGSLDELVAGVDLVACSTATPRDHPTRRWAERMDTPVCARSDVLAAVCAHRDVVAVAGTHGKTTTSALLATVLDGVGSGDGFLVGTRIAGLGTNAAWRRGPGLVVEADESDGTFLALGASSAIVTNVEADHLSYWGTEAAMVDGFERFVGAVEGPVVLCLDDPGAALLVPAARRPVTYGTSASAAYRITDIVPAGIGVAFALHHAGTAVEVTVPGAPGIHNARNAAAAVAMAHARGVPLVDAAVALGGFRGVARRFEIRGESAGITFVDSYDHLPTEVAAALDAARSGPFERVVCLFQPHRFTRTRDLWPTFAHAFDAADVLAVVGLYPAGEQPVAGVSGKLVLDAVLDADPHRPTAWLPDLDSAERWLRATLRPGDLCLTLNAGDLTTLPDRFLPGPTIAASTGGNPVGGAGP